MIENLHGKVPERHAEAVAAEGHNETVYFLHHRVSIQRTSQGWDIVDDFGDERTMVTHSFRFDVGDVAAAIDVVRAALASGEVRRANAVSTAAAKIAPPDVRGGA